MNYHECAVRECTNPDEVGLGCGDTLDGQERICISLGGPRINPDLAEGWHQIGWISLTEDCAQHLYELLQDYYDNRTR